MLKVQVGEGTKIEADLALQSLLDTAYADVKSMLQRNQAAFDEIVRRLCTPQHQPENGQPFQGNTLPGSEVRDIVTRLGSQADLERREQNLTVFI